MITAAEARKITTPKKVKSEKEVGDIILSKLYKKIRKQASKGRYSYYHSGYINNYMWDSLMAKGYIVSRNRRDGYTVGHEIMWEKPLKEEICEKAKENLKSMRFIR